MENNIKPSCEVKFNLDTSKVLACGYGFNLAEKFKEVFNVDDSSTQMNICYLDTPEKVFNSEGWTLRVRRKKDKKIEYTYKKRYSVNDYDTDLSEVLAKADCDGFSKMDEYDKVELDWGLNKKTLSISIESKVSAKGLEPLDLPNIKKRISIAIEKSPEIFDDWGGSSWGEKNLLKAKSYGDVMAMRYSGLFHDIPVDIEVWEVLNKELNDYEMIAEISFKTDSVENAAKIRENLKSYLIDNNYLLNEDKSKTQIVLDRY